MLPDETLTLRCDSGTIFGRDVVPEVCRTSAMSSGSAKPFRQSPDGAVAGQRERAGAVRVLAVAAR